MLSCFLSFLPPEKKVSLDELGTRFAVYNIGGIERINTLSEVERNAAWEKTCKALNIDGSPKDVWRHLKGYQI